MRRILALLFVPIYLFADPLTPDLPVVGEPNCDACKPVEFCPCPFSKEDKLIVDLVDPSYSNGVLSTNQGGIIHGTDLRIQAQNVTYIQNEFQRSVYCEGNLLVDYREWVLTGDAFFYDFHTKTGYLLKGRTAAPPWFVGSKRMEMTPDGEIIVLSGYLTTSEGPSHDVRIHSPCIRLKRNKVIIAKDAAILVKKVPIFYFPAIKLDLKEIQESPFSFQFGWGGFLASHISVLYKFLDYKELQGLARFDGFFKYGLGVGVDTIYDPKCRPTEFYTRNYWAHDLAISTPQQMNRYRYQGVYSDKWWGDVSVKAQYDVVSDAQMATQYNLNDFDLKTAGRTRLDMTREHPWWLANLVTQVRVNNFQSINQELPSFKLNLRPREIPHSGVIVGADFSGSYLNYIFSQDVTPRNGFNAGRIELRPLAYRPFHLNWCTFTPEVGGTGIYYSNSPADNAVGQAELFTGAKLESMVHKGYARVKHVVEPYLHYHYLSATPLSNSEHFIFTIQDGLSRVNRFRVGVRNSFFLRDNCQVNRRLWMDLWANLFIKNNVGFPDQKLHLNVDYQPHQNIAYNFFGGYDMQMDRVYFANNALSWTAGEHLAFAVEYRYRNRYYWRKANFYNFVLENVRTQEQLVHSTLSDQRDTFLLRFFLRLQPGAYVKFDIRNGSHRRFQRDYFEWDGEYEMVAFEHWRFNFIYQHRESDDRYSMSIRLDPGPPKKAKFCPHF